MPTLTSDKAPGEDDMLSQAHRGVSHLGLRLGQFGWSGSSTTAIGLEMLRFEGQSGTLFPLRQYVAAEIARRFV